MRYIIEPICSLMLIFYVKNKKIELILIRP